jgi:hypothetical protein
MAKICKVSVLMEEKERKKYESQSVRLRKSKHEAYYLCM